ncbi:unnamed protein product [Lactuca saligna]|uniref:Uncharacterized protein n=1 Tax=Lactuca saligna TaxID=75948 RepID=A0AA35V586_LACSI|nr:unnamed protein product [Lactuca saligna]
MVEIRYQLFDQDKNKVRITAVCYDAEKIRYKLCCKGGKAIQSIEIVENKPETPKKLKPVDKPKPPEPEKPTVIEKKPEPKPPPVVVLVSAPTPVGKPKLDPPKPDRPKADPPKPDPPKQDPPRKTRSSSSFDATCCCPHSRSWSAMKVAAVLARTVASPHG